MFRLFSTRKLSTAPSISDLLSQYDILKSLAPYLTLPDLQNLADTCKAHHEYIKGNQTRFKTLFQLGRCSGGGSARWKSHELRMARQSLISSYLEPLPYKFQWYIGMWIPEWVLLRFNRDPFEVDLAMEKIQTLHKRLPCRDSFAKGVSQSRPCVKCGVSVCNVGAITATVQRIRS